MRLPGLLALGYLACAVPSAAVARGPQICGDDSYVNVDGRCVHRPIKSDRPPDGATAKCRDGTYSFSLHHSGTCSHHGGVAAWL